MHLDKIIREEQQRQAARKTRTEHASEQEDQRLKRYVDWRKSFHDDITPLVASVIREVNERFSDAGILAKVQDGHRHAPFTVAGRCYVLEDSSRPSAAKSHLTVEMMTNGTIRFTDERKKPLLTEYYRTLTADKIIDAISAYVDFVFKKNS